MVARLDLLPLTSPPKPPLFPTLVSRATNTILILPRKGLTILSPQTFSFPSHPPLPLGLLELPGRAVEGHLWYHTSELFSPPIPSPFSASILHDSVYDKLGFRVSWFRIRQHALRPCDDLPCWNRGGGGTEDVVEVEVEMDFLNVNHEPMELSEGPSLPLL
ncbi:hypothetical protein IE53DRAFT_144252 [Violaceomyces palustris]|uniref:Uncharacterized protein n=1 Tax=Violaceomyces palustris TaxID=1673888 RepID=A0ACD0NUC4_9BASI|nr:hypothetical protein IE53DRAFT_144252 [Violaceomyces palustris]